MYSPLLAYINLAINQYK